MANYNIRWNGPQIDDGIGLAYAGTTPPREFNLPLSTGVTNYTKSTYAKTQAGVVVLCVGITVNALQSGRSVGTLPAGYRPTSNLSSSGCVQIGSNRHITSVLIRPNGSIEFAFDTSLAGSEGRIYFTTSFIAAS